MNRYFFLSGAGLKIETTWENRVKHAGKFIPLLLMQVIFVGCGTGFINSRLISNFNCQSTYFYHLSAKCTRTWFMWCLNSNSGIYMFKYWRWHFIKWWESGNAIYLSLIHFSRIKTNIYPWHIWRLPCKYFPILLLNLFH